MADAEYQALLRRILSEGERVETRNARCLRVTAATAVFARTPLVGVRRTAWKNALREWEWIMSGSTNIRDLHPAVRPWWHPWADPLGHLWGQYGQQFRRARGAEGRVVDQIADLVGGVRDHPYSRRNVLTTWNAADMTNPKCVLTCCHNTVTQAFVSPATNALSLVTYQRSADVVVGLGANWVQMWAFLLWLARRTGRGVGTLTWVGGDVHVYEGHLDLARRVADAAPPATAPELVYTPTAEEFRAADFALDGEYRPAVDERAEMVV